MVPVYVRLVAEDGSTEAHASRYTSKSVKLPAGQWRVWWDDGREQLMFVDDMPRHWIKQMGQHGALGQSLSP